MTVRSPQAYAFFLGGRDLEMKTIHELLQARAQAGDRQVADVQDAGLAWGARVSDYGERIGRAAARGLVPVLVELERDTPVPPGTIEIDHHGDRCGEPAALRQVFELLSLPSCLWTRDFDLVAANDVGHVAGLRRIGATKEVIAMIRARDRAAQGISPAEEAAGLVALDQKQETLRGTLIVVHLPHERTATVADTLALAGDARDLLVMTPHSCQFFGAGSRIARLDMAFPGGWRGGELPRTGFWGISRSLQVSAALLALQYAPAPK
ncbi:hypothetical protein ORIO_18570 [Cereibacter azotoformans]|uniref:hypothetical protein n=1 Tax=Cereibacter azotoformans TaxID=43057 RepID=UPI001EEA1289|nr:hypothetical protein [Cereibacter azotoformans]ULB11840.1 hypothetical protein ORIO_18570 [Cereibacter azotoformans]